jgi:hypothetical protein
MLGVTAVNTPSRMTFVVGLAVLGAAAGCGGRAPLKVGPDGGGAGQGTGGEAGTGGEPTGGGGTGGEPTGGGGGVGGNAPCEGLDPATCKTRGDCEALLSCPDCAGGRTFAGCVAKGGIPILCPAVPCPVPPTCDALDETSCKTRSDCHPSFCPTCDGGQRFALCAAANEAAACPGIACPIPCGALDEVSCNARSDCRAGYCTGCQRRTFVGCGGPGVAFACPAGCPMPGPCATETTRAGCDSRTDCHSVFVDRGICDCAVAGCCTAFDHCADGAQASCKGNPICHQVPPYCEAPAYVVAYTASCFEGCVRPTECAP